MMLACLSTVFGKQLRCAQRSKEYNIIIQCICYTRGALFKIHFSHSRSLSLYLSVSFSHSHFLRSCKFIPKPRELWTSSRMCLCLSICKLLASLLRRTGAIIIIINTIVVVVVDGMEDIHRISIAFQPDTPRLAHDLAHLWYMYNIPGRIITLVRSEYNYISFTYLHRIVSETL